MTKQQQYVARWDNRLRKLGWVIVALLGGWELLAVGVIVADRVFHL